MAAIARRGVILEKSFRAGMQIVFIKNGSVITGSCFSLSVLAGLQIRRNPHIWVDLDEPDIVQKCWQADLVIGKRVVMPLYQRHFHQRAWINALSITLILIAWVQFCNAAQAGPPLHFIPDNWQTEQGLPQNSVTTILQSSDGYLWIGTLHGLARFDGVSFSVFNSRNCPELRLDVIVSLFETPEQSLLIGTEGGSLVEFKKGQFRRLLDANREGDWVVAAARRKNGETTLVLSSGLVWQRHGDVIKPQATNAVTGVIAPKSVCEDLDGNLWMIIDSGSPLRLGENRLEPFVLEGKLAGGKCTALVRDQDGRLWLGTSAGLGVLHNGRFEAELLEDSADWAAITALFPSRDGGLWVQNGYRVQKRKNGQWVGHPAIITDVKTWFREIGEDRWGRLLIGCNAEGLLRVSEDGTVLRLDRRQGLSGNTVRYFFLDRENNEWLGLEDGGLTRLRPRVFETLADPDQQQAPTLAVCEDKSGDIWAGTSYGGVFRFQEERLTHFLHNDLRLTHVWSIYPDQQTNIWGSLAQFVGKC